MIQEMLKAFILIFIAEMGDKTQILAMAFATRYPVKKVLLGIFIGVFINHGLAVILGSYISNFIPINTVQIIAGLAFVGFSLWALKTDGDDDEDEKQKSKFGPVITVALAFFIGELWDKTQLTAITLATDATYPLFILGGTVLGMIVTGGIGIIVGKTLGAKIPELTIKIIAASVFMFFGITKLYQSVPDYYLNLQNILLFFGIITIAVFMMMRSIFIRRRNGQESALVKKSRELYDYYNRIGENINSMCLGVENCGKCEGNKCIVGHTKSLIKYCSDDGDTTQPEPFIIKDKGIYKPFNKEQAMESLIMTLDLLKEDPNNAKYKNVHEIRKNLEMILFGRSVEQINNWDEYARYLIEINESIATSILVEMNLEEN